MGLIRTFNLHFQKNLPFMIHVGIYIYIIPMDPLFFSVYFMIHVGKYISYPMDLFKVYIGIGIPL